ETPERQRRDASLLPVGGEIVRRLSGLESLGWTPGQELDLTEVTEARAAHVTDRSPARLERFLEELERRGGAPGLRIREPKKSRRRPAHAAPGSRQCQAAFQVGYGLVEVALDDVEAPQRV